MVASACRGIPARRFRLACALVCAAALLAMVPAAQAFGPQTHAWLANRALQEVRQDCRLELAGRRYALDPASCQALRAYPAYFLAGAIGGGSYPDPLTAQATLRQGVAQGWQSGEWLQHLVVTADSSAARAFALGLLLQAGQDVFANSYVNTYAGQPWSLQMGPAAAARHSAIEQYLDARLPAQGRPDLQALNIPVSFLRDNLLFSSEAQAEFRKSPATTAVVAMNDLRLAVTRSVAAADSLQHVLREMLAYYNDLPPSDIVMEEEFTGGWRQQRRATVQAQLLEQRWTEARLAHELDRQAAAATAQALQAAATERAAADARLAEQQQKLAGLSPRQDVQHCRNVRKWINKKEWVSNRVCETAQRANPDWKREQQQLLQLQQARDGLAIQEENLRARQLAVDRRAAVSRQAMEQARTAPVSLPALPGPGGVDLRRRHYEVLQVLQQAQQEAGALARITQDWEAGILRAGNDYLYAGLHSSQARAQGRSTTLLEYRRWLDCSGKVFLREAAATADCKRASPYHELLPHLQRMQALLRLPELQFLQDSLAALQPDALAAAVAASDAALQAFVKEDSALALQEKRLAPQDPASLRGTLQNLLGDTGGGEALLTLRNGADIIDADAGIRDGAQNGVLSPDSFHALQYAERFSRMALLSGRELNRLSGHLAGYRFSRWKLHPEDRPDYSLLFRSLRNLEGNQQWQPYGLPYARSSGQMAALAAEQRHYGYGPADGSDAGLAIFINPAARQAVFRQLFPAPLSLVETHPRMQLPNYPFPSCADNPFPVTFTSAGGAASGDPQCAPRALVQQ
ncbi:MAG TPA: hypothetical protein VF050_12590 [Moraxellaceae bacterium]